VDSKNSNRTILGIAAISLLCAVASLAKQDKRVGPAPAPAKPAGQVEMERLKFYLGEWLYTETYPKSATDLSGRTNTGVYTSKPGPGGYSLINTFHSQGSAGDFEGMLILTYDLNEKAYKAYAFGNEFPGAIVETGAFEGDALVFRAEWSIGGQVLKLRNVTRVMPNGTLESDEFVGKTDGREELFVHVVASRKK